MPTNANAYNSRLTDEALEKRFRDTFRSQGGAELVDDLYASGVIVPVVDFTQAAEGTILPSYLQTAWDSATTLVTRSGAGSTTLINTPGFWKIDLIWTHSGSGNAAISFSDGISSKNVWRGAPLAGSSSLEETFYWFLRSGDSLTLTCTSGNEINAWYRQVADVSGNLVDPSGFTSS